MEEPFVFSISSGDIDDLHLYMMVCEFISPDCGFTHLSLEQIVQVVKAIHQAFENKLRNSTPGIGPDVNPKHLEEMQHCFQELALTTGEMIQDNQRFRDALCKARRYMSE